MKQLSLLQPSLNGPQIDLFLLKSLTHVQYQYTDSSLPQNLIDLNNFAPGGIRKTGGVFSGNVQVKTVLAQVLYPTVADGMVSINLSFGSYFWLDLTDNVVSFEIINAPPGVVTFTLILQQNTQNIKTIAFNFLGAAVKWANNTAPYAVASGFGHIDMFSFSSRDQGATWLAQTLGQDFKSFNS